MPIRQGQTRYQYLVMQFNREEEITAELNMSEYVYANAARVMDANYTIERRLLSMRSSKRTTKTLRSKLSLAYSAPCRRRKSSALVTSRGGSSHDLLR